MSEQATVHIEVLTNAKTGLLVAVSDDLKGLYVHGRTERELEERIPEAIKALFEAEGKTVHSVTPLADEEPNDAPTKPAFSTPRRRLVYQTAA